MTSLPLTLTPDTEVMTKDQHYQKLYQRAVDRLYESLCLQELKMKLDQGIPTGYDKLDEQYERLKEITIDNDMKGIWMVTISSDVYTDACDYIPSLSWCEKAIIKREQRWTPDQWKSSDLSYDQIVADNLCGAHVHILMQSKYSKSQMLQKFKKHYKDISANYIDIRPANNNSFSYLVNGDKKESKKVKLEGDKIYYDFMECYNDYIYYYNWDVAVTPDL